jgi:beta-glucosidase/6-phospho-beta-glucosidase/beta-galactosidase
MFDYQLLQEPEIKVRMFRLYGIPWHRIQPAPGKSDWSFADRAFDRLAELRIEPIVDLVHYGLPGWIEGAYLNPDFPELMAEYAGRVAERFRDRLVYYTPLNEPRITAWYCGKLGWWPPGRRGWRGFLHVMNSVCRGVVKTVHRLAEISQGIVPVHVDATDLYETVDPELQAEVIRRQEMVFLALDLISGRVNRGHRLYDWIIANEITSEQLEWFKENRIEPWDLLL